MSCKQRFIYALSSTMCDHGLEMDENVILMLNTFLPENDDEYKDIPSTASENDCKKMLDMTPFDLNDHMQEDQVLDFIKKIILAYNK